MQHPHLHNRVAVGGLSQRRIQQLQQASANAVLAPGTTTGFEDITHAKMRDAPPHPSIAPQLWPIPASTQPMVSAQQLSSQLSTDAWKRQHQYALEHHRLSAQHPVQSSEAISWVRLLVASCCITLVILIILFAFGVIDVDTRRPTQWIDRAYGWIASVLAPKQIDSGHDSTTRASTDAVPVLSCTRAEIPSEAKRNETTGLIGPSQQLEHDPTLLQHSPTWSNRLSDTLVAATAAVVTAGSASKSVVMADSALQLQSITGSQEVPISPVASPLIRTSAATTASRPLGSKGEDAALAALQRIFGSDYVFTKLRPSWLKNPRSNRCMELDLYNEKLKLGCECDGVQHHVFPNSFHHTREQFNDQIYRDRLKDALCQQVGVTLIRIPFTVPLKGYEAYLREELRRIGFVVHFK